uniref:RING finger and CHY zinc finger domain-containing protein 1 n=2 Tax=Alexandrium monilatum TaxID=311494 RepID=A0A7S4R7T6_9DINO
MSSVETSTSRVRLPGQGCRHYRRRCCIVAPCCGEAFWCRHCHNDAKASSGCNAHEIDRTQIREVVCQACFTLQPTGPGCRACGQVFGTYFCKDCNFWDDDGIEKQVFHCDKCGICRVGGRENYFHCDACGSCYPNEIRNSHTCVENAMHQNCPVCLQDLFQSTTQVTILQCGHTIHQDCLRELQLSCAGLQSLRCPICSASLYEYGELWTELDRRVAETPMPAEYQRMRIGILCNDCQQDALVPPHVVGLKCPHCRSYNTRRA